MSLYYQKQNIILTSTYVHDFTYVYHNFQNRIPILFNLHIDFVENR